MKARFLPLLGLGLTVHYSYAGPASISVDLASSCRPVTHAASGSLYGLSFDGVPPDNVIDPLKPRMFTQMAPNGHQLPNGTTQPTGDALKVAPAAARAGAEVTIRMPDWYPTFPYQWVSWEDWTSAVQQQLAAKLASPNITNIYGWELWNEPDFTWDVQHAGPFNDGWLKTYQLVRGSDPQTPIVGPSATHYYADFLQPFLSFCKANNVLPDVVSWHELATGGNADVEGHVAAYRQLEEQLGIIPRPISINEYGRVYDMGAPGFLLRYIARVERAGVDSACLAFWHLPGRLGDLLDANARPNGACGFTSGMVIFPGRWFRLRRPHQAVLAWMLQPVSIARAISLACSLAELMVIRWLRFSIYLLICVSADMLMSKWHPPLLPVLMARLLTLIFFSRAITRLSTVTSSSR
jgi:hypothetical protein